MTHEISRWSDPVSRRTFCGAALAAAVTIPLAKLSAGAAQGTSGVKFFKNFAPGHIGVKANQQQALEYAVKYGFGGIAPSEGEFASKSAAEIGEWVALMKQKGIRYGAAGLPVEFRRDEAQFQKDMAQLPKRASLMKQLGVTRVATWLLPGHNELTYLQNFKIHRDAAARGGQGVQGQRYPAGPGIRRAAHLPREVPLPLRLPQADMMELVEAIGTGNVGLLFDSWHWYTSHGTVAELSKLSNQDIVHVHVNDAPAGIEVDQQVDNRRKLPATTNVIDLKGFINALVKIGYDGPVECEPFDQELRKMDQAAIVQTTAESLNRLWGLIAT